jgi:ribosomal protein L37AE/L43A
VAKRTHVRVRQDCRSCHKLHTSESRKGLWFTCKHCGERQPGPGMAQSSATPQPNRRRATPAPVEPATEPRHSATRYLFGTRA